MLVFCVFGSLAFLPFVLKMFLILWIGSVIFVLRLPLIAVHWYLTQCFTVFLIVEVFTLIIVMIKAIACIWSIWSCRLVIFSIFYPRLKRLSDSGSPIHFVANIVESTDDSTSSTLFLQVQSFSVFVAKLFDFGSNPIFRVKFPQCAENIFCYFLMANLKQICLGSVRICPWHIQINPFSNWSLFLSKQGNYPPCSLFFGVFPKTKSLVPYNCYQ